VCVCVCFAIVKCLWFYFLMTQQFEEMPFWTHDVLYHLCRLGYVMFGFMLTLRLVSLPLSIELIISWLDL
jgi:hypothetical protein